MNPTRMMTNRQNGGFFQPPNFSGTEILESGSWNPAFGKGGCYQYFRGGEVVWVQTPQIHPTLASSAFCHGT